MSEEWTVDRLHHGLPNSANRRQLLLDVNGTPLHRLPDQLAGWTGLLEKLETARPGIEEARRHYKETGALPPHDGVDRTEEIIADADPHRGAA